MTALLSALLKPVLTLLAVWFGRKAAARNAARVKELKSYVETSQKINSVEPISDADAAADFLRQRAKRKRDL
jgi:hypothetical protein